VWRNSHKAISVRRKLSHFWSIFDAQRLCSRRQWPWTSASNVPRALACQRNGTVAMLDEFARVLRKAGAIRIARWVAGRTLPR